MRRTLSLVFILNILSLPFVAAERDYAELMPRAKDSLILDITKVTEQKLVAVGIRGHILLSDDLGKSWRQAESVPTRSALTSVDFVDAQHGWAVGHDSVILKTEDGGINWSLQYEDIEREQPLLDVVFTSVSKGVAIGAYGLYLVTADGGANWEEQCQYGLASPEEMIDMGFVEEGFDVEELKQYDCLDLNLPHLYSIKIKNDGTSYIVGEAGLLARSDDAGENWQRLSSPYNGSFYHLLETEYSLLAMGLRGNLFRSEDGAQTWQKIETGVLAGLNDALELAPGKVVIVGMDGVVLTSLDDGRTLKLDRRSDRMTLTSIIPGSESTLDYLVVASESGLASIAVQANGIKELSGK